MTYNEGWEMYFNSVVTFSIFDSFLMLILLTVEMLLYEFTRTDSTHFVCEILAGVTLTLSTHIEGKNFSHGGHKFGIGLDFEA